MPDFMVHSFQYEPGKRAIIHQSSADGKPVRWRAGVDQVGGAVSVSRRDSHAKAAARSVPHISDDGRSPEQQAGRSGRPKISHR
jgi:hypothetical protein